MKMFYVTHPNANTLPTQLTWTHYRSLLRVESGEAPEWYAEEAARGQWSSRQLDRQISSLNPLVQKVGAEADVLASCLR